MTAATVADPRVAWPLEPGALVLAVGPAAAACPLAAPAPAPTVVAAPEALRAHAAARIGLLVADGDAALLAACLAILCPDATGTQMRDPAAVAVVRAAGDAPGRFDLPLFDWGYVRLKPGACALVGEPADVYLRSYLLTDFGLLREPSSNAVSMETLGSNGRFANQLWQYAFLWFYGLRNNCRVQTPRWIGNLLYDIPAPETPDPAFRRQAFTVFTGVERYLWTMGEPPVNLDYFGYFQEIPASWRRHRRVLRRLFTPKTVFVELIERWFERSVAADTTPVSIHVRRGDYPMFDHNAMPWFRPIPTEWYDALLAELWPTLADPLLLLATDDAKAIGPHFEPYAPLIAPARELALPELGFMPDFMAMQRARVLAISNSSFSRMAAMLAPDDQIVYIPNMHTQRFERYDPWMDDDFWLRFEA
jgi:hypothetical protein